MKRKDKKDQSKSTTNHDRGEYGSIVLEVVFELLIYIPRLVIRLFNLLN